MNDVDFEEIGDDVMMDVDIWLESAGRLSFIQLSLALAIIRAGLWLIPTSLKNLLLTSVDGALDDLDVDQL